MLELAVLVVFALLSLWVLGVCVLRAADGGRVWTGTDGAFGVQDQMQYLAWIRDASNHGLSSNLYVLKPQPYDYIQPAVAISAALTALGMAPWLALLLWKPVAVIAIFLAVRGLVHATIDNGRARAAALALGLLFTGWGTMVADWA
jgi:hypothetical protein